MKFKIFTNFSNFSSLIFVLKCANTPKPKYSQGSKCANTPYCILLQYLKVKQNSNSFHFKDHILKDVFYGVVHKFQSELWNESYGECVRKLKVKIGEYISILPITKSKINIIIATQVINNYFAIIQHPMMNLAF